MFGRGKSIDRMKVILDNLKLSNRLESFSFSEWERNMDKVLDNLYAYLKSVDLTNPNPNHLLMRIFENLSEGIMITDQQKNIILVN